MCSPEAGAVLNVFSAMAGYQDKKEQARATQASNTVAKANASKGLHDDYGFIDWQKGEVKDGGFFGAAEVVLRSGNEPVGEWIEECSYLEVNNGYYKLKRFSV